MQTLYMSKSSRGTTWAFFLRLNEESQQLYHLTPMRAVTFCNKAFGGSTGTLSRDSLAVGSARAREVNSMKKTKQICRISSV